MLPSKNNITIHVVNDIPWSNLNRDDSGTPKRTIQGGVERGLLSSQSIKRAARLDYERRALQQGLEPVGSIRSRNLPEHVAGRAATIAQEAGAESFDVKKALKLADKVIKALTGKSEDAKETVTLLSTEEIEALAGALAQDLEPEHVVKDRTTGALAIAAFGRMFANETNKNTEAAIAVSPAVSMHGNPIETDYFIAGDDLPKADAGAGAAHLDTALYTNGVFYRTVTIDIAELHRNWTGISGPSAKEQLRVFVNSLIKALPTGKKNSTSPYVQPPLVLAEQQDYRMAYSTEKAVAVARQGGYLAPSLEALKHQYDVVRRYDPGNYGETLASGTTDVFETVSHDELVDAIVAWILEN